MSKKVLIIEDNAELQEIYTINFEAANFIVKTSNDGMDGIVKILHENPSIIILDIMMPGIDGFEVLRTIRDQSSIRLPIIVCSNLSSDDDEKRALSLGADLYLRKSEYDGNEIVKKAIILLEKK